jgi:hypothetical protein
LFERQEVLRKVLQTPDVFRVYRFIDDVLWNDWDPIGINDCNVDARDEYQCYIVDVLRICKSAENTKTLAEFLYDTELSTMGLTQKRMDFCHEIAQKIVHMIGQ